MVCPSLGSCTRIIRLLVESWVGVCGQLAGEDWAYGSDPCEGLRRQHQFDGLVGYAKHPSSPSQVAPSSAASNPVRDCRVRQIAQKSG
eukprot:5944309-Pleurochrysis_carterae.AAC.1